jgi:predicted RecB family nuclease
LQVLDETAITSIGSIEQEYARAKAQLLRLPGLTSNDQDTISMAQVEQLTRLAHEAHQDRSRTFTADLRAAQGRSGTAIRRPSRP